MKLMDSQPDYRICGDSAVMAVFGDRIEAAVNARVIGLFRAVQAAPPLWLENLHPAYTSLQIDFDPAMISPVEVIEYLRRMTTVEEPVQGRNIEVPVVYGGPDLDDVAAHCGLSRQAVVELHSSVDYKVAFLGFAPGFAYLMGLPPALETPRFATPRVRVPAGSVAIGGAQTGVYPLESPGGWRIIGQSYLKFPPDWADPGDTVRFVPA